MKTFKTGLMTAASATVLLLVGCAGTPSENPQYIEAQAQLEAVKAKPNSERYAALEVSEAEDKLEQLGKAISSGDEDAIDHFAYVTKTQIEIADETIDMKQAMKVIENAEVQRKDALLAARTREAEQAKQQLQTLRSELDNMQTQQTDRGLVITLNSILFDTGEATLKPGARKELQNIANYLEKFPERNLVVEGFTDSTGPEELNERLSQERADAVRQALVSAGIDGSRIQTRGYGEQFPIASNDTNAGRQLNRRVEVVISNSDDTDVTERQVSDRG